MLFGRAHRRLGLSLLYLSITKIESGLLRTPLLIMQWKLEEFYDCVLIVAEAGCVFGKEKNASHSALNKRHKLSALHVAAKRWASPDIVSTGSVLHCYNWWGRSLPRAITRRTQHQWWSHWYACNKRSNQYDDYGGIYSPALCCWSTRI